MQMYEKYFSNLGALIAKNILLFIFFEDNVFVE